MSPASPHEPPEKRTQYEDGGDAQGKDKETIEITKEEERGGEQEDAGEEGGRWVHPRELPWAAEFRHYTGRQIHHVDSVKNLGVAFGMLRGSILPKDAQVVQGLTEDITTEIAQALFTVSWYCFALCSFWFGCLHLVNLSTFCWQAGAWALVVNERCKAQEREIEKLKQALGQREDDLKIARETCDLYLEDFQRCNREKVLAECRATKAEEDATTLRVTRVCEVDAAKNKGYDEGWDVARVEYKKQVREIETELYNDRFLDGVRFGHEVLLSKLDLSKDLELRDVPQPPPEELVMLEEEDEAAPNPEELQALESHADPNAAAPTEDI